MTREMTPFQPVDHHPGATFPPPGTGGDTPADVEAGRIDDFYLDMPGRDAAGRAVRRLTIGWLSLALGSLVLGGLLTLVIVLSRTPYIQDVFPWTDLFHTALVVHVDLTVLVWFLAVAGMFWSLNSRPACAAWGWVALVLATAGALTLTAAPFVGTGEPLMVNYIPVLDDPVFFTGLILFTAGFVLLVGRSLVFSHPIGARISGPGALRFGLFSSLIAAVVALSAFAASYLGLPEGIHGERYFELLFWGGGHTLQFVHIQLMLVAWLWLATATGITSRLTPRVVLVLFAVGLIPVLLTPLAYLNFPVDSPSHQHTMTWLMRYGGGLAAVPIGLVILFNLVQSMGRPHQWRPERAALFSSMVLFGAGGLVAFMIQGSDVTVPAHYHGSIVAVTLAYMGMTYHLLPRLGFARPSGRAATLQPWLYGGGQLLHVIGLAWSGGYGVQRKTAGEAQMLDAVEKIAGMGLMGLGGLIAVSGGVLFLVLTLGAMRPQRGDRASRAVPE
ncbi:MAG: cbb3-type cytochrome c oxidase subunit I [Gammaproteobacteria bacterium]|nr:cbb3-type cytochrome c oxidase subunit I [Gammaproteobacteria bacterium]